MAPFTLHAVMLDAIFERNVSFCDWCIDLCSECYILTLLYNSQ